MMFVVFCTTCSNSGMVATRAGLVICPVCHGDPMGKYKKEVEERRQQRRSQQHNDQKKEGS